MPDARIKERLYKIAFLAQCHDPVAYAQGKASTFGLANKDSESAGAGCQLKEFATWQCWIQMSKLA